MTGWQKDLLLTRLLAVESENTDRVPNCVLIYESLPGSSVFSPIGINLLVVLEPCDRTIMVEPDFQDRAYEALVSIQLDLPEILILPSIG